MSEQEAEGGPGEFPDASSLTVGQWREITSSWGLIDKGMAYRARALPVDERNRQAGELLERSKTFRTDDARKLTAHIAAIYSLTDEVLDNAIRSFRDTAP